MPYALTIVFPTRGMHEKGRKRQRERENEREREEKRMKEMSRRK